MKASYNKSRIFKAAWTMVRKYSMDLSSALRKAWQFAKNDVAKAAAQSIQGFAYRIWKADNGMRRFYFEDNSYVQLTTTERKPYGYYERHRYCKGERFETTWVKAIGTIASQVVDHFLSMENHAISKF